MRTLNVYLSTTGGGKRDIMRAFGEGAELDNVKVKYITEHIFEDSDYAMVFAYKSHGTNTPNHRFRQEVVDKQGEKIFFVDHMRKTLDILGFHINLYTHMKQIIC